MSSKTSIGISDILKIRLSKGKRKRTYEEYIDSMLSYFEITNIDPDSVKIHPGLKIKDDVERVIRIVKAIEKDKMNPMLDKINKIYMLISGEIIPDDGIDVEDINKLINKNDEITVLYQKEKSKNDLLESKLAELKTRSYNLDADKKFSELSSLVDWLISDTNFRKTSNTDDLIVSPVTLQQFKSRFNSLK